MPLSLPACVTLTSHPISLSLVLSSQTISVREPRGHLQRARVEPSGRPGLRAEGAREPPGRSEDDPVPGRHPEGSPGLQPSAPPPRARTEAEPRGPGPGREPSPQRSRGCSSISRTKSRGALSALCLLSRQLLPRRSRFVDTVVRKSANVHLSGGPPGTPKSCDSSQNINTGQASQTETPICFPGAGRERGVVEDKAADNAACLQWTSPRRINDIPGDSSSLSFN